MQFVLYFLVIVIIIKVFVMVANPGAQKSLALRRKAVKLGTIKGKTYNEIINVLGQPSLTQTAANGGLTCTWSSIKYAISLGFDEKKICYGVLSEVKTGK